MRSAPAPIRISLLHRVPRRQGLHLLDYRPQHVVYGISLKSGKPLTVDNLFTFAQVSLLQAATALRNSGIQVSVVNIPTIGG